MSSAFDQPRVVAAGSGPSVERGALVLRLAQGRADMDALLRLRALSFRGNESISDRDRHDDDSMHLWIGTAAGPPLATLRARHHVDAQSLQGGYSAGFFDLAPLARLPGTTLELGRLCLHSQAPTTETMRLIWTGIARLSARFGAARLIGGTSLIGADPDRHRAVLAYLAAQRLGPAASRPAARAGHAFDFAPMADAAAPGLPTLPPILRFYLSLGGWVSGQMAIDPELDTCILFTCVELAAMPASRQRLMRALAGAPGGDGLGGDGGDGGA